MVQRRLPLLAAGAVGLAEKSGEDVGVMLVRGVSARLRKVGEESEERSMGVLLGWR